MKMCNIKNIWDFCMDLVQKQRHDEALQALKTVGTRCALTILLHGKINLAKAEHIISSFSFRYYPTDEAKRDLHALLMETYGHFLDAGKENDINKPEEHGYIVQEVKCALEKLDGMLIECHVDPKPEDEYGEWEDEEVQVFTDNLTDHLAEWSLELDMEY